ncbi:hypothetical protein BHM03_00017591 [Ensete ventricosum]|nr:hypothetical protein BHM03_00017591 [Ensete ventricosum]
MKFLERKELANYNFQNEFMKPFVIVMRKSRAVEIRELIIRCFSQMVLARVSNVKSGWKSMFMVFATASYDDHKNIVLLAFEIIEKILRDYFPYITETETTTFTDCVNCLIAFTNSRFNKDISLNAIAFLRFCAAKLAEGDIGASARYKNKEAFGNNGPPSPHIIKDEKQDTLIIDKDDHLHLWFPLLAGDIHFFGILYVIRNTSMIRLICLVVIASATFREAVYKLPNNIFSRIILSFFCSFIRTFY